MLKMFILPLVLISTHAFATATPSATDSTPIEQILKKLNTIEQRLDNLENKKNVAVSEDTKATTETESINSSTQPKKSKLTGGIVIKIRHADKNQRKWHNGGISAEHFAGYISQSSDISTEDVLENTLGYKGTYALTAEGYFNAKEKGLYNFGILHDKTRKNHNALNCFTHITINGERISELQGKLTKNDRREENLLTDGSVTLEAGMYEYTAFSVCDDDTSARHVQRKLLVKTPSDLSMRPITNEDILHKI